MTPKAQTTKDKKKWDFTRTKNFCTAKDTVKKVKRQATAWENLFPNCIPEKGLVSRIYSDLSQLNNQMTMTHLKKMGKELEQTCLQAAHEKMFGILGH